MDHLTHMAHTVGSFVLVLGVLVSIHELGHYIAARICGVHVEVFSLGFGPALKSWYDKRGTEWRISLLPLGGYVRMHGMTADAASEARAAGTPYRATHAYIEKPVASRAFVAAAGPLANFLLAVVLFAGLLGVQGRPLDLPVVGEVSPNTAAATAGLQSGDVIRTVDGVAIADFRQLRDIVQGSTGRDLTLAVHRGTQDMTVKVHILPGGANGAGLLGVTSGKAVAVPVGPIRAVIGGFTETWETFAAQVGGLVAVVTSGSGVRDLGGPIMIAHLSGQVADLGIASLIKFMALLSVNLGLVNLLPIPVLDGGHLMFYAAEAVRGRPVPARTQEYGYRLGLAFIMCLFLIISINDLKREGAFLWVQHHLMG